MINEQIRQVEAQLNQMESVALPKGMGTVLFQQTEREVGDWGRFDSSKQVGDYTVFRVYPEEQAVIAMISNRSGQDYKDVPGKIVALFFERPAAAVMSY